MFGEPGLFHFWWATFPWQWVKKPTLQGRCCCKACVRARKTIRSVFICCPMSDINPLLSIISGIRVRGFYPFCIVLYYFFRRLVPKQRLRRTIEAPSFESSAFALLVPCLHTCTWCLWNFRRCCNLCVHVFVCRKAGMYTNYIIL